MSMGRYEIIYILAPNTPEDTMKELVTRFESELTSGGGVLLRVEKWGRKKLAYEVRKFREGFFILFVTDCQGEMVTELERRFRMTDQVIKFMTVRIDEELMRAGKMPRDEELGKPRETERIDRSRRSGPKPSVRTDGPGDDAVELVEEETAEPAAATDAELEDEIPSGDAVDEAPVETAETAEVVQPAADGDNDTAEDNGSSEDK